MAYDYIEGFTRCLNSITNWKTASEWKRKFGIVLYADDFLLESAKHVFTPEIFLTAFAEHCRSKGFPCILLLNTKRTGKHSIGTQKGLSGYIGLLKSIGLQDNLFYFGTPQQPEGEHFGILPAIQINHDWIFKEKKLLSNIIEDVAPIHREVKEKELLSLTSLEALSSLLKEKLAPPSLSDDVTSQIKSAGTSKAISEVASLISPTASISKGLKYASQIYKMFKKRRREDVKAYFEEWETRINNAYAPDTLKSLISTETLSTVIHAFNSQRFIAIIDDTQMTPHDFFASLLLFNILDEIGVRRNTTSSDNSSGITQEDGTEKVTYQKRSYTLLVDSASNMTRYDFSTDLLLNFHSMFPQMRIAALFSTQDPPRTEQLLQILVSFMQESTVLFDVNGDLLKQLLSDYPATVEAYISNILAKIADDRATGKLSYALFSSDEVPTWTLQSMNPTIKDKIYNLIKDVFTRKHKHPLIQKKDLQKPKSHPNP
ncbi:MAG: hypothetical protein ACTSW4_05700 [Candidatus Ranarchaeia archaeon]